VRRVDTLGTRDSGTTIQSDLSDMRCRSPQVGDRQPEIHCRICASWQVVSGEYFRMAGQMDCSIACT